MAVLDDIKTMQGIATLDTTKDTLITLYTRKAVTLISNYLNMKPVVAPIVAIDISVTYPDAVIEYVIISMNKRGNEELKQFSQGSRSGTYVNDLPDSVKALLPAPYVTMLQSPVYTDA